MSGLQKYECKFMKLSYIKFHRNLSVVNRGVARGRTDGRDEASSHIFFLI